MTRKIMTTANWRQLMAMALTGLCAMAAHGQQLREGYVDWNAEEDENFFVSRVRPHMNFRDKETQVRPELDETNDKQLCMWMPIGTPPFNALPDGVFDRDVFSMWHYVTHLGDWTAPLPHVPGALTDVAHRNGVGVSATLSMPYGSLSAAWRERLDSLTGEGADIAVRAHQMAETLRHYGVDGIGYNSEFSTTADRVTRLADWHEVLLRDLRQDNPLAEIVWYDGTSDNGSIMFDQGLSTHNDYVFGDSLHERTNLFLNYNWNTDRLLQRSVTQAEKMGRSPLDLYCGFNLQGREPHEEPRWTLLKDYPLSIGLWGAHSENMFYESRSEQGYSPNSRQETYQKRQEMWFTGGTRSVIGPHTVNNSLRYDTDNTDFHGMSAMMSARSALCWNLTEEPFVTCFNLGNGRYFNWNGTPISEREWYSLGLQDHLPTWRWWIAEELLGRDMEHEAPRSLQARLSWDDAWMGGSMLQLTGKTEGEGLFVHLYQTRFELKTGDRIALTYKLATGEATPTLVLLDANHQMTELPLKTERRGEWVTLEWQVGEGPLADWNDETLSLLALHIRDAQTLDLRLGRLAVCRREMTGAEIPVIDRTSLLMRHRAGLDGKVIFHTSGRYNLDAKTSFFKVYAEAEGGEVTMVGATTSWAAIAFAMPDGERVRLGVSAVGLDMLSESDIAWGEWMETEGLTEAEEEEPEEEPTEPEVYPVTAGSVPRILALRTLETGPWAVNDTLVTVADVERGEGALSQAIALEEKGLGVLASDVKSLDAQFFNKSFSIGCWVKVNKYHAQTQLLSITDRTDYWPQNNWGWFWHSVGADGKGGSMTWRRKTSYAENISYSLPDFCLTPGRWHYLLYVFDMDATNDIEVRLYLDGELQSGQNDKGKHYTKTSLYSFRTKNVLAVGGMMHGSDGIDGCVDELSLWDHAVSPDDLSAPFAHWDFEQPAAPEGDMSSDGAHEGLKLYLHHYKPGEREGEGEWTPETDVRMTMGAPLAPGEAWKITTNERWSLEPATRMAEAVPCALTPTDGQATFAFRPQETGSYEVSLTLSNVWGSDSMTLSNVLVTETASLPAIEAVREDTGYGYDLLGRRIAKGTKGVYIKPCLLLDAAR